MQIDRRITNGLAWAGVVLVVGIPLADLATGQLMGDQASAAPAQIAMVAPIAPVPVALSERPAAPVVTPTPAAVAVAPKPTPAAAAPAPVTAEIATPEAVAPTPAGNAATSQGDAVDSYLQTGKALPSYITGAATPSPQAVPAVVPVQTPAIAAPVATDPVVVAALGAAKTAPVPMPLSMRPEPVLIVDGPTQVRNIQTGPGLNPRSSATVTYDDLQDWESGPLAEFLARRQGADRVDPNYDADGFFLDQGPNGRTDRGRLIGPADDFFVPFAD